MYHRPMDFPFKLVLPAALVVTTFASANGCLDRTPDYCVDIENKSKCESEAGCGWDEQNGECANICYQIEDQQECEAIERCEWNPEFGTGDETGGEVSSCGEPFT